MVSAVFECGDAAGVGSDLLGDLGDGGCWRVVVGGVGTVADLAEAESASTTPNASIRLSGTLVRREAANGLVSVWGNRYSVPPPLAAR